MPQYVATVHLYDSREWVRWSVSVYDFHRGRDEGRRRLSLQGVARGVGTTDPAHWLETALRYSLLDLQTRREMF
jgi:hypothetical protein